MLTDRFIRRPVLSTVLSLLVILAGAISIPNLPVARYPQLTPPSVTVTSFFTGANAQSVESSVTTPLEQVINGAEGMTYLVSSSTNSGVSTITVFFEVGRDPDLAAVDVQNRVNQAMAQLPQSVQAQGVSVQQKTSTFLMVLAFYSPDGRYDSNYISNYTNVQILGTINRIPGANQAAIFGVPQ